MAIPKKRRRDGERRFESKSKPKKARPPRQQEAPLTRGAVRARQTT
jgi:hypothetical protein